MRSLNIAFLFSCIALVASFETESFLRPAIVIPNNNASIARFELFSLERRQTGCQTGYTECGTRCIPDEGYACCSQRTSLFCDSSISICAKNNTCTCESGQNLCGPSTCLPTGYSCCGAIGVQVSACPLGTYCYDDGCCKEGKTCSGAPEPCLDYSSSQCGGKSGESPSCCTKAYPYCFGTNCSDNPDGAGVVSLVAMSTGATTGFFLSSSTTTSGDIAKSQATTTTATNGVAPVGITSAVDSTLASSVSSIDSIMGTLQTISNHATESTLGHATTAANAIGSSTDTATAAVSTATQKAGAVGRGGQLVTWWAAIGFVVECMFVMAAI